ncbi:serine-rich adhesin for platelets isoform X2 [Clinocottus analis]|uniref:serine-rich adhesin for platelets isoform X2 n=1 Tax=Clinocottus analis TaxID=304258 RepID=UPI0035C0F8DE
MKPISMKTYGKERRKLAAWFSPDNRKQAFDSTRSTDGDSSVFEPPKPTRKRAKRTSVSSHRTTRPAKRKALLCLAEKSFNEENAPSPSHPPSAQQSKTTRVKKTSVASRRAVRPANRRALLCLTDATSDEDNISRASPPCPEPAQWSRPASGHLHSMDHFVTHRRRAAATKPAKSRFSTLDSSDDFTSRRIVRPSRRSALPAAVVSSAENSLNAAGAASFAIKPFQEISLNELTDSLRPCARKPIFCSTPSAGSFSKRPRLKPPSDNDHSCSPPSMSVSCIGALSTFQEDVDSPAQPASPLLSSPPIERLRSQEKREAGPRRHEASSGDLFTEPENSNKRRRRSEEDATTRNVGGLSGLNLLSPDDSRSSSRFVSAAGGLEWLREYLKERCLAQRCEVQLKRLDELSASQLRGQTAYSSCLGLSSSTNSRLSTGILQPTEPSLRFRLSVSNIKALHSLGSINSLEASENGDSVTGHQSTNTSPSARDSHPQESMEQLASVIYVDSTHREPIGSGSTRTPSAVAVKDERRSKKCTVQGHETASSHANVFVEDPEDVKLLGEIAAGRTSSTNHSGLAAQGRSDRPEAALVTALKEKCQSVRVLVEVRRVTLSRPRGIQQLKVSTLDSSADAVGSAGDQDAASCDHRSARDVNRYDAEKGLSPSTGNEVAAKSFRNVPRKGNKKTHAAAKEKKPRRSTSADRPGTTRKASVSGLSVNRWKNHAGAHAFRSKAADSSINDLISTQHKQPREWLGSAMSFNTPLKAGRLNVSSLLADLTPNTHTWSRLKAALSVHRKSKALLTPRSSRPAAPRSSQRADLVDVSQDLFATPFRTLLPKRLRPGLLSSDSPVLGEDGDLSDAEKVCAECSQPHPLPWEECILPHRMKQCVKIGEGTFGEVFSTTNASGDTVALKVIPVEGSKKVNGEDQKTFGEILHEIIISKELSSLKEKQQNNTHGFIGLHSLHCVQGRYPPDFLNAWDAFDQRKGSENDRPDFFETDQLFIILEFEFGGADLENSNGTLKSLMVAKSILHQVTAAMAVAEQELLFEHSPLDGAVLPGEVSRGPGSA